MWDGHADQWLYGMDQHNSADGFDWLGLDERAIAFDWTSNLVELALVVDRLPWQNQVAQALKVSLA